MKEHALAVLPELDSSEMLELVGGETTPGSGFATDFGYAVGYFLGHLHMLMTTSQDSSFVNAKVGSAY